jgi:hypothetical protein
MNRVHRNFTRQQKVAILWQHLVEKVADSDPREELGLQY